MTYELALKLNEAGYPNTLPADNWDVGCTLHGNRTTNEEGVCPPCKDDPCGGCRGEIRENYKHHTRPIPDGGNYGLYILHPTLEELIEACGDSFQNLNKGVYNKWECNVEHFNHDTGNPEAVGETPIEAVANLWLELNKK